MSDPDLPLGWSYNPASWTQRLPIVGLALAGFVIALYLALYQWDVLPSVWEPFFGNDSHRILKESWISKLLPVPDAFLGALSYLADAIGGVVGGRDRWRTMPWIVILFGLLVGPLGLVSILLVVSQPVLFSAWCTLCLASAVISVLMIGPAMDEVLASLQYLRREHARGRSLLRATLGLSESSDRDQPIAAKHRRTAGARWAQFATAGLGLWLMAAPALFGYDGFAADSDRAIGPILATFGITAIWEVTRATRWANLPAGVWLLAAPWLFPLPKWAAGSHLLVGAAVLLLLLPRARTRMHMAGGWRYLLAPRH
ncbi:MAG: vitamin K epoxide reductase family protein [Acidobacteria bacterium]|nr:vitamin K epoxide reductase family protein [Acidobacteriota bacterium]